MHFAEHKKLWQQRLVFHDDIARVRQMAWTSSERSMCAWRARGQLHAQFDTVADLRGARGTTAMCLVGFGNNQRAFHLIMWYNLSANKYPENGFEQPCAFQFDTQYKFISNEYRDNGFEQPGVFHLNS